MSVFSIESIIPGMFDIFGKVDYSGIFDTFRILFEKKMIVY